MKKIIKVVGYILLLICSYILIMFLISFIPVNSKIKKLAINEEIDIYINSNGVHTDLVVPYKTDLRDWSKNIAAINAKNEKIKCNYLSIGWGDKGFYLDIEEWADLDFKTAFNAALGLSDSAMHVTFLQTMNQDKRCKKIKISRDNYKKLIAYIESKFKKDSFGNFILIDGASYANNDIFFEANGRYSFYYTCNSWANEGLKKADQKAALWTLHEGGIFTHYK
nr:TIGR02117 family protein [uncultured Flavobacterium sp.]